MRGMQQDDSATARQAGLRVPRLSHEMPQALPHKGVAHLSPVHRAQYGAVSIKLSYFLYRQHLFGAFQF